MTATVAQLASNHGRLFFVGYLLTGVLSACSTTGNDPRKVECDTIDVCIAQMRAMARTPGNFAHSMTRDEDALIANTLAFDDAVARLVPLLADPDLNVANIAAAALRDAKYIDAMYLPQIVAGLDRDLGWLSPALGRMPGEAPAREAVARLLVSDSAPQNQEAYAVKLCGARAIPFIVDAAWCRGGCNPRTHYVLGYVLGEMGPERGQAGAGLLEIARSKSAEPQVVGGALQMIAMLREAGLPLATELIALRGERPEFQQAVDAALVGIGSERSGEIFALRLRLEPDHLLLRDLAETGKAGREAGPEVVALLHHPDWSIRLAAARALGFIGYEPAVPDLIALLEDPADVRLTWAAAESLGRLQSALAVSPLRRLAVEHWYPPVRSAARNALSHIDTHEPYAAQYARQNFPFEFFAWEQMGEKVPECRRPDVAAVTEPSSVKLRSESNSEQLAKLSYPSKVIGYGAADEEEQKAAGKQIIEVTSDNMIEHVTNISQAPSIALRVDGGWLVGADRGEWGGELMFIGDGAEPMAVLQDNIEDIYHLGDRVVAVTGLAHLSFNGGLLYELERDAKGTWMATPWRTLPGAPKSSWLVASNELLVNTYGGSILIAPDGRMRMAPCRDRGR